MERLLKLKDRLAREKGHLEHVGQQLEEKKSQLTVLKKRQEDILKAREVIQLVAKQTQQKLESHIGNLVSAAEASIYEDPYEFVVEFVTRRGQTECDLLFKRGMNKWYPLKEEASGGGSIDAACLSLRVAFMSLEKPRSRPVLLLDQPFGNTSPDYQPKCSAMVKRLSEQLGLQIIMISHADGIIDSGDRVFEVVKRGGISSVSVLGEQMKGILIERRSY